MRGSTLLYTLLSKQAQRNLEIMPESGGKQDFTKNSCDRIILFEKERSGFRLKAGLRKKMVK
jgi:hypothetical protein